MKTLGFVGIGLMGEPMARNLLEKGFSLRVWNRTRGKAERLQEHGALVADTVREVASGADAVITMLANDEVVESVLFAQGLAEALSPEAVFIDMSSIAPASAREHAARLAERGVAALDAPVSGGTRGAAEGTLAIMAGGEQGVFERCVPVFEAMGRPTRVGPTGTGQLAKLCNQVIVAITIGAVAEGLLLAERGGADPAAVREALVGGFADSRILREHGQRMIERDFVPGGPVRNQVKDLHHALEAATEQGLELPIAGLLNRLFESLADRDGGGELDHSALFLELEGQAGRGVGK